MQILLSLSLIFTPFETNRMQFETFRKYANLLYQFYCRISLFARRCSINLCPCTRSCPHRGYHLHSPHAHQLHFKYTSHRIQTPPALQISSIARLGALDATATATGLGFWTRRPIAAPRLNMSPMLPIVSAYDTLV